MGTKPKPRTLTTPVRLLTGWDTFIASWMICVPDAFALPAKRSGLVFCRQPLDNTIELLSYGADCPIPPPMVPAETFSGEPTPRLRLVQQSSSLKGHWLPVLLEDEDGWSSLMSRSRD